jgi:hypothetical protein
MGPILSGFDDKMKMKRQYLRRLALGVCEVTVNAVLERKEVHFFEPFVEEYDNTKNDDEHVINREVIWFMEMHAILEEEMNRGRGDGKETTVSAIPPLPEKTYGLKQSIFSVLVQRVISSTGELLVMPKFLVNSGQYLLMADLANLGEHLNSFLSQSSQSRKIEETHKIIQNFFTKHGLKIDDYMSKLDEFRKKYGLATYKPSQNIRYSKEILWLIIFRNTFSHLKSDKKNIEELRYELWKCLPKDTIFELADNLSKVWYSIFKHSIKPQLNSK